MRRALFLCPLLAVVLAGCSTTIDAKKGEQAIKGTLEKQGATIKSVKCPTGLTAKKGATFTCTATDVDGSTAKVAVTETDAKGRVSYDAHVASRANFEKAVAAQVTRQSGVSGVTVTCPHLITLRKGAVTMCNATGQGDHVKVVVTQSDAAGTSFKVQLKS